MTSYGLWLIFFAVIYTGALILAGTISRRKSAQGDGYFVGGRIFNKWIVCFCITGLFSGSTFISVLELSYLTGISAIWYGVAETVQILIIALVIIGPFRKKLVVTVSGMIGERYGRKALGIAGAITAFAFPMWSVATAIAFASAVHVFTGISLTLSVAFTNHRGAVFRTALCERIDWNGDFHGTYFTFHCDDDIRARCEDGRGYCG